MNDSFWFKVVLGSILWIVLSVWCFVEKAKSFRPKEIWPLRERLIVIFFPLVAVYWVIPAVVVIVVSLIGCVLIVPAWIFTGKNYVEEIRDCAYWFLNIWPDFAPKEPKTEPLNMEKENKLLSEIREQIEE